MMGEERKAEKRKRPRTCVGCGEESPKRELLRVIRTPEGEVRYDPTGRANGRGAYICRCRECLALAKKRKALSRALKTDVSEDVYENLLTLCTDEKREA
ncbi:MAG TPA: DUF448 domain-containing protein [Synergistaceae bacterium]|jgi:hypothetical protein|nr:DUF448 domain-containing protein [Synergistaceae bacterium]